MHASTDAKQPIAIIIPNESHLRHALEQTPIAGVDPNADLHTLCKNEKVSGLVMKECNALGKKNGFKPMETLEAVILTADEWTPESGLVTAAQKVQRKKVAEKFEPQIKVRFLSHSSFRTCSDGVPRRRSTSTSKYIRHLCFYGLWTTLDELPSWSISARRPGFTCYTTFCHSQLHFVFAL